MDIHNSLPADAERLVRQSEVETLRWLLAASEHVRWDQAETKRRVQSDWTGAEAEIDRLKAERDWAEADLARVGFDAWKEGRHNADEITRLEAELAEAKAEMATLRRGGIQLGKIVDRQCLDILDITGLHDLVNADGDGDWGLIWDRLGEMVRRGRSAKDSLEWAERAERRANDLDTELAEAKAEADRAEARYRTQKTKARRLRKKLRDNGLLTLIHDGEDGAPSLPVHGTPEALRWAADEVELAAQEDTLNAEDDRPEAVTFDAIRLRYLAAKLEAERVREATHTAAIEKAAKVMADVNAEPYGWDELIEAERDDYRMNARALVAAGADLAGLVDGASE